MVHLKSKIKTMKTNNFNTSLKRKRTPLFLAILMLFLGLNYGMAQDTNALPPLPQENELKTPPVVVDEEMESLSDPINETSAKLNPKKKTTALDYVKTMIKKGATFYFNTDKITADKALELVTNSPKLNISSQTNNDKSTVYLSKEGMTVLNGKLVKQKD